MSDSRTAGPTQSEPQRTGHHALLRSVISWNRPPRAIQSPAVPGTTSELFEDGVASEEAADTPLDVAVDVADGTVERVGFCMMGGAGEVVLLWCLWWVGKL